MTWGWRRRIIFRHVFAVVRTIHCERWSKYESSMRYVTSCRCQIWLPLQKSKWRVHQKIEVDATGSKIAPMDAFVTYVKLVTPTSRGTVEYLQKLDLDVLMWSASDYARSSCPCQCLSREQTYASPRYWMTWLAGEKHTHTWFGVLVKILACCEDTVKSNLSEMN